MRWHNAATSVCSKFHKVENKTKSTSSSYARSRRHADNQRNRRARHGTRGPFPCLFFPQLFPPFSPRVRTVKNKFLVGVCVTAHGGRCCGGVTSHMRRHTGPLSSHTYARLSLMRHAVFPNREILRRREQTFARSPRIATCPTSARNDALARKVLSLFADTFQRKRARNRYVPWQARQGLAPVFIMVHLTASRRTAMRICVRRTWLSISFKPSFLSLSFFLPALL